MTNRKRYALFAGYRDEGDGWDSYQATSDSIAELKGMRGRKTQNIPTGSTLPSLARTRSIFALGGKLLTWMRWKS